MSFNSFDNPQLKFKKRSNMYSNSTGTNTFYPETLSAYSYSWWQYLKNFNGTLVFNDYSYSPSTSSHQWKLESLLKELNIKIDLYVNQRQSLSKGIDVEHLYEEHFKELERFENVKLGEDKRLNAFNEAQYILTKIDALRKYGAKCSKERQKEIQAQVKEREKRRKEEQRAKYLERKAKVKALEPELKSLDSIDLGFSKLSDLNEVNINQ